MKDNKIENINDFWPPYFNDCLALLFEDQNAITNFLENGPLVFGRGEYMPLDVFQSFYKEHCIAKGLPYTGLTEAVYATPFGRKKIVIEKKSKKMYPRRDGQKLPLNGIPRAWQNGRCERVTTYLVGVDYDFASQGPHPDEEFGTEQQAFAFMAEQVDNGGGEQKQQESSSSSMSLGGEADPRMQHQSDGSEPAMSMPARIHRTYKSYVDFRQTVDEKQGKLLKDPPQCRTELKKLRELNEYSRNLSESNRPAHTALQRLQQQISTLEKLIAQCANS